MKGFQLVERLEERWVARMGTLSEIPLVVLLAETLESKMELQLAVE
jgi:hypothetical protein